MNLPHPFSGPPPIEVPLPQAPLVRVLTQVSFPPILNIAKAEAIAPFQERIRSLYPVMQTDVQHAIQLISPSGQPTVESTSIWRFEDKAHHWRVSLAPGFLTLETTHYTTRTEFISRATKLIEALQETLNPQVTLRVGLRYIDRLQGTALESIATLINPQFLGPNTVDYEHVAIHVLTQALFHTEEGAKLNARWGKLPPNASIDPNAIEPINEKSWVMDFDMFIDSQGDFSAIELSSLLERFAKRIYAVFRFMVTKEFLELHGGKP